MSFAVRLCHLVVEDLELKSYLAILIDAMMSAQTLDAKSMLLIDKTVVMYGRWPDKRVARMYPARDTYT
jgi:hypothetical protein